MHIDRHHHGAAESRKIRRRARRRTAPRRDRPRKRASSRTTFRLWHRTEARPWPSLAAARRIAHSGAAKVFFAASGRGSSADGFENPRSKARRVASMSRLSASTVSRQPARTRTWALSQLVAQHALEHLAGRIARQLLAQDQLLRHLEGGEMCPAMTCQRRVIE